MYQFIVFCFFIPLSLFALKIEQTPIEFSHTRVELTKEYIKEHYGLHVKDIKITPKIIVIHHTAIDDYGKSLARFVSQTLPTDRPEIQNAGAVNVSAHFMVERDGTVHQLMPLDTMARHVIGLNYNSIGIENVGGENSADNLTQEQLKANVELVNYLKEKFKTIEYVIGHYEYRCFEKTPLWLEKDKGYRTEKDDPSVRFMNELRKEIKYFKSAPCPQESK
ncbi:MAG: N-acetylmuramoyl-L-alanine amidase [Sulfurimonas sp. RIFOXYD12_FULL_33_39]|uniref:N-acetylmuramoyl-L-alanine amidase n=1 Tax=unclassified Sulfurimonas TaxID=2623549 RepID=UPI0008CAC39D|nr:MULTISPECIES: peptidoglycan recognition family protein [unclassified Sulfurimonas]OHE09676.1 MAG: N-acetylmuramoyl-L-alanine amidase [Sulfurimonas sp. RIFOXYD12_FULL_33_39]OHE13816.1 MAG: N-acetylmuramoyl-L-alanine amidase [Sulfurimonas sp. RIFOXYD2_FULL_34_21]DAB28417.1 MAG TPA: N-acetylmuramoyl-L-alanine amidase [Sulfurimonas sp. UBA10385]